MTEDNLNYADVFSSGMRIEVELPLAEEKQFRDDAKILFIHQDLMVLQLTREMFPAAIVLEIGTEIHLRTGHQGKGYRCRAILLNYDRHSRFKIRLIGEILAFNAREFFRIDVFIPLSYQAKSEQDPWTMHEAELESYSREPHPIMASDESGVSPKQPLPVAANLSGAGVKINIPERFELDALLDLTLYLPFDEPRTMSLVGQVVHVEELHRAGDLHPMYGTALHFVGMDDAQRETLIGFIQGVELKQIRRRRELDLHQGDQAGAGEAKTLGSRRRALRILWAIFFLFLLAGLVLTLNSYRGNQTKGEIERTFEEQIRKIIERNR